MFLFHLLTACFVYRLYKSEKQSLGSAASSFRVSSTDWTLGWVSSSSWAINWYYGKVQLVLAEYYPNFSRYTTQMSLTQSCISCIYNLAYCTLHVRMMSVILINNKDVGFRLSSYVDLFCQILKIGLQGQYFNKFEARIIGTLCKTERSALIWACNIFWYWSFKFNLLRIWEAFFWKLM